MRERLKSERAKRVWTQNEVANKLNISAISVRSYENGKRNPSPEIIGKFVELYHVEAEKLFPDIFLLFNGTKGITKEMTK
ncbi:helix-turn-helix transcriptional regulator [Lactobacillus sp. CC-MHH1034]|nr:helix-turn-helix transcriptional regulator [Agrilactobacillus fermenti]